MVAVSLPVPASGSASSPHWRPSTSAPLLHGCGGQRRHRSRFLRADLVLCHIVARHHLPLATREGLQPSADTDRATRGGRGPLGRPDLGPVPPRTTLIIMVDNTSAVGAFRKGSSRKSDVNAIVGAVWLLGRHLDITLFFHWVPSKYNIADLPSRGHPPSLPHGAPSDVDWASVRASINLGV